MKVKDSELIEIIKDFYEATGFVPTFREIAYITGLKSISSVHARLHKFARNGIITFKSDGSYYKIN